MMAAMELTIARTLAGLTLCAGLAVTGTAGAADLHYFWEQRCADCHGHAGDFARSFLRVEDGELIGRHPVNDVRLFLSHHGVPAADVEAVYDMLRAQAGGAGDFARRCGQCHGAAADLARRSLTVEEGRVRLRGSDLPVEVFLDGHAGLSTEDVPFFAELLQRIAEEVNRP